MTIQTLGQADLLVEPLTLDLVSTNGALAMGTVMVSVGMMPGTFNAQFDLPPTPATFVAPNPFSFKTSCYTIYTAPCGSCPVMVTFDPMGKTGTSTANLTINHNGAPTIVHLTGSTQ